MVELLKPIVDLITAFESNEPQIHRVIRKLNDLENSLTQHLPLSPLQKSEEIKIITKFKERKEFGTGPIHLAAHLLDPDLQGSLLEPLQLLDAMSFIYECTQHMKLDVIKVRENLTDYRDRQGLFSRMFLWEGVGDKQNKIKPLLWWRGLRGICDVADVAIRILGAPITSAATERTFSTFSWIHSKKRNRLSSERAAKLTYISYNWKLMNVTIQPKPKKNGGDGCRASEEQTEAAGEELNIQEREDEDEEDQEDAEEGCDEEDNEEDEDDEEEEVDQEGLMDYKSD